MVVSRNDNSTRYLQAECCRVIDVVKTAADDVRSVLIQRCGHFIAEEQPEYLIQQLLTFFDEEN